MVKTYRPSEVQIIVGAIVVTGYAEGSFCVVARSKDSFSMRVGADGEGSRAQSSDKSGTITLTLTDVSSSNALLSALATLDENGGNGVVPILVKDGSGTTLLAAGTGWIQKPADVEFAQENTDREWVLATDNIGGLIGGN